MTYRIRNIGIAIALAIVAGLLTTFYVTNYKRNVQQGEENVAVYVASKDIALGTAGSEVTMVTLSAGQVLPLAELPSADAALHVPPYYNRPNQEGIYAHLAAIAEAVDIPLILYNVPARTITDISVETMARLARIANVIGVKDATGALVRTQALDNMRGLQPFAWDGTKDGGAPADEGHYRIEVIASVGGKNVSLETSVATLVNSVALDPTTGSLVLETHPLGDLAMSDVQRVL